VDYLNVDMWSPDGRWWSSDGRWWWDGAQWRPVLASPDGQLKWFAPSLRISQWTVRVIVAIGLWVVLLSAPGAVLMKLADNGEPGGHVTSSAITITVLLGILAALATVAFASWLQLQKAWALLLLAPVAGAAVQWFWVASMYLVFQPDTPESDNAASIGAGFVGGVAPLALILLTALGAGATAGVQFVRERTAKRGAVGAAAR
jgi:hypothetical protein